MRIRRASPADAPALTRLARDAKASWGYPAAWLEAWRDALTITTDYVATHLVLVAEDDGAGALGTCALERMDDDWSLEHVWVAPAAQGRGVGRALVAHALAAARADGAARVHLLADPHAVGFYERLGARAVASVPAPMTGAPERRLPLLVIET